jgi:hypothetical protein
VSLVCTEWGKKVSLEDCRCPKIALWPLLSGLSGGVFTFSFLFLYIPISNIIQVLLSRTARGNTQRTQTFVWILEVLKTFSLSIHYIWTLAVRGLISETLLVLQLSGGWDFTTRLQAVHVFIFSSMTCYSNDKTASVKLYESQKIMDVKVIWYCTS